jgi:uncharacterized membrane protein
MKSKILVVVIFIATIWACTTEPLLPDGFTGETADGTCATGIVSFQYEILPLISSGCAMSGCHDAITAEEGVVLIDYQTIMREVTPNNINESELYKVLNETGDEIMPPPPDAPFTQIQKDLIKKWINQGALNTTCKLDCDSTANATFTAVVYPIVEMNCVGCHNDNRAEGAVKLNSYARILPYANSGILMGTIEHKPGYPVMPTSGIKLTDCNISLLNQWIANGALDN